MRVRSTGNFRRAVVYALGSRQMATGRIGARKTPTIFVMPICTCLISSLVCFPSKVHTGSMQLCANHHHIKYYVLRRQFTLFTPLVTSFSAIYGLPRTPTKDVLSRIAQTTAALTRLKPVWIDKSISLSSKIRLKRSLVTSVFLYACESWTLTVELQRSHGNEVLPQDTKHLIQRPCYQRGSPCQDPAGNWTTRRPNDR